MKTTLITVFVYVVLFSLITIIGSALAMVILRSVHLPEEATQRALWYFKVIIISCGSITTLAGVANIGYIMLH